MMDIFDVRNRVRWCLLHWDTWMDAEKWASIAASSTEPASHCGFDSPEWLSEMEQERLTWEAHVNLHMDCLTPDQKMVLDAVKKCGDLEVAARDILRNYEATRRAFYRGVNSLSDTIQLKLSQMSQNNAFN